MHTDTKKLYAQSHKHGLLRNNKIPKIGEIQSYESIEPNGELTSVKLIIFDWYENGMKDIFIFDEHGVVSNAIHPTTPHIMTKQYAEILSKSPSLATFTDEIICYFVFTELGF